MRALPGDTERALADGVAAYLATIPAERMASAEREGTLPPDVVAQLGRLGALSLTVPEADGGLGASAVAFALVLEELAAVWPSLAVAVSVNSGIVAGSIVRLGTPQQKAALLPRVMDGSGLAAFCLTEPSAGSDAAAVRATARRDGGGGWILDGQKQFVTNARYAPFLIVLARVGAPTAERPHAGITAFVVPRDAAGLSIGPAEKKMGLHASDTSAVILEAARVGANSVLGEVGRGFATVAMAGLDSGRIGIAAQSVGIARGALDIARAYAQERSQFDRPIASFQAIRFALAQAHTEIEAARLLTLRAARLKDAGEPFGTAASQAKLYASDSANRACHVAVQVLGGYGYLREYGVERFARDARATPIYEGTNEVQRLVIARALLRGAA